MARKLTAKKQTDEFILKVLDAARHHASGMVGPVTTIYSHMIQLIDFKRDDVEAREWKGETTRAASVTLNGIRMAFSYNYRRKCILLKYKSSQGQEIASFDWNEAQELTLSKLASAIEKMEAKHANP